MGRRIAAAISRAWWAVLGAVGLPRDRWQALPRQRRRAVKAVVWAVIGLLLIAGLGVWKNSALVRRGGDPPARGPVVPNVSVGGRNIGKWIIPGAVLALAITYPYYIDSMPQLPIFGPFPQMSTMVVMMIFTIMALGLNFVVGYAGLLDLGYVAFYAIGAYMAGWFASNQFANQNAQPRRGRPLQGRHAASTSRSGSCCSWPVSQPRSSAC